MAGYINRSSKWIVLAVGETIKTLSFQFYSRDGATKFLRLFEIIKSTGVH